MMNRIGSYTAEFANKFKNYAEYVQEIEPQLLIFSPFCAHQSMDGPVSEKSIEFTVLYKSQVENLSKHECK